MGAESEFDCPVCGTRHEPCVDMAAKLREFPDLSQAVAKLELKENDVLLVNRRVVSHQQMLALANDTNLGKLGGLLLPIDCRHGYSPKAAFGTMPRKDLLRILKQLEALHP